MLHYDFEVSSMTLGVPPFLLLVVALVLLANVIVPFLIFLEYRRRLYRKLQQRRNSDEQLKTDLYDDEEYVPSSAREDSDGMILEVEDMEEGSSLEDNAHRFVEKQEQMLKLASRSRWIGRSKGYNTVSAVPRSAS